MDEKYKETVTKEQITKYLIKIRFSKIKIIGLTLFPVVIFFLVLITLETVDMSVLQPHLFFGVITVLCSVAFVVDTFYIIYDYRRIKRGIFVVIKDRVSNVLSAMDDFSVAYGIRSYTNRRRDFRIYFNSKRKFDALFTKTFFAWSENFAMSGRSFYERTVGGEEFYLVLLTAKKIALFFPTKYFNYPDSIAETFKLEHA